VSASNTRSPPAPCPPYRDFNARTGNKKSLEVVIGDPSFKRECEMRRNSKKILLNAEGKKIIDMCEML
jgi:hypothetical protein